jgi:hypothetical protein
MLLANYFYLIFFLPLISSSIFHWYCVVNKGRLCKRTFLICLSSPMYINWNISITINRQYICYAFCNLCQWRENSRQNLWSFRTRSLAEPIRILQRFAVFFSEETSDSWKKCVATKCQGFQCLLPERKNVISRFSWVLSYFLTLSLQDFIRFTSGYNHVS